MLQPVFEQWKMTKNADKNKEILMEIEQEIRGKMPTRNRKGRKNKQTKKTFWILSDCDSTRII